MFTAFVTFVLVAATQHNPPHVGATIGLVATLGFLYGLYKLGRVYIWFKDPPKTLPDEERPSSRESRLHPTMCPTSGREEPSSNEERPIRPWQGVVETTRNPQTSPDDHHHPPGDNAWPPPLNVPHRSKGNADDLHDVPQVLIPGLGIYHSPRASGNFTDDNGSPILEDCRMRGGRFAGNGPGNLLPSARGLHEGPLHVVNLVTVPALRGSRRVHKKHNLSHNISLGIPELAGRRIRVGSPKFRCVNRHSVKICPPVPVSPSVCVDINDDFDSDHSATSGAKGDIDSSSPLNSPISADTVFTVDGKETKK